MKKFSTIIITILFCLLQSCTSYNTDLNEMEKLKVSSMSDIVKGQSCSENLFGGFRLPYLGNTAIKISGDESVIAAIKDANINHVYAVDKMVKNYVVYSKRCTIVFGQNIALVKEDIVVK